VRSDYPYSIYQEPEYNNSILRIKLGSPVPESLVVSVNFGVARSAIAAFDGNNKPPVSISNKLLKRFLSPDLLVPIDGVIQTETHKVIRDDMSDLDKAKAIYNYVSSTLSYDKSGVGWGRGDAVYACNARTGNCTDFHSLFIGMARAAGIPARFVMGFPLPPDKTDREIAGYHCWAECYIQGIGWIPVDASEASKHPKQHEFYFGNLDADRVEFSIGRDISIEPKEDLEPLNFFIYPQAVLDGRVLENVDAHFRFAELKENGTP
jgi:transglutaminase-like putative cysteine protease